MRTFSGGGGYGYRFDIGEYFPRAIKTLCLICVGVFLLQELSGLFFHAAGWRFWIDNFGLSPAAVIHGAGGLPIPAVWQPVTYLFLHAGILHILFNLLYLAMFGADLEHMWGAKKFYTYFFLCGIGAGFTDLIVRTILDPHMQRLALVPTIGASGAIYGVLLAAAVITAAPASLDVSAPRDHLDAPLRDRDGRNRILPHHWRDGRRSQPRLPPRAECW